MTAQPIIDIQPTEINGEHFVGISINEMDEPVWRGPFPDADAARAKVDQYVQQIEQLIRHWHTHAADLPAWLQAAPETWDFGAVVAYGRYRETTAFQSQLNRERDCQ